MTRRELAVWLATVLLISAAVWLVAGALTTLRTSRLDHRIDQLERLTAEQIDVMVGLSDDVEDMKCRVLADGRCTIKAAP